MRWRKFLFRKQWERQLDREMRFHIEQQIDDLVVHGLSREQARRRVMVDFGGPEQMKERCRDEHGFRWLDDFFRDITYGIGLLRRSPVFTTVAVLSLALGIGANTAIFSLIDAVILRSMPVAEPDRLVQFVKFYPPYGRGAISHPLFEHLRTETQSFTSMFAYSSGRRTIDWGNGEETVNVALASPGYYSTLGVAAAEGRTLAPEEERSPLGVISHAYWHRRFGGDPHAIGRTFRLNHGVFTIIGVTARGFTGPIVGRAPDITIPWKMDSQVQKWLNREGYNFLSVMARLKPGVTVEEAHAEVSGLFRRHLEDAASQAELRLRKEILGQSMEVRPAANGFIDWNERYSEPLLLLMGIVALVLLIACANLANLLLARATARRREISIRLAIGAGRGRIIRQLMTESWLLATMGGALGIALALWLSNGLIGMMSADGPRIALEIKPDLRVLSFTAAASVFTCLLFGLIPAWQAARSQVNPVLKEGRTGERQWFRRGLMVAQVSLSLLLVIGAGLFMRTLVNLYSLDTGFERNGVLMFGVDLVKSGYKGDRIQIMRKRILERLNSIPGVESASFALLNPLSGGGWNGGVVVEGYTPQPEENAEAYFNAIQPQYFHTLRTPLLLGREFSHRDTATSPKVVIVNETFVKRYFGGHSPLGKLVNKAEIVGIVKDMKYRNLREEFPPTAYWPVAQTSEPPPSGNYFVRGPLTTPIVAALHEIDKTLRIDKISTLEEHFDNTITQERLLAMLGAFFGVLALVISCLGIYGVTAFQVARRTTEVGIRIALGARSANIMRMALSEVVAMVLIGLAFGIPVALALTRFAEKLLFHVKPADPVTYILASLVLSLVALAAGAFPALRATRVDPVTALRYE